MTEFIAAYGLDILFVAVTVESVGLPIPGESSLIVASVPGIAAATSTLAP